LAAKRQVGTESFLERHPVFRLEQAARAFGHQDRRATLERLRYHVSAGRLKQVTRGVYARVPLGVDPHSFRPDAYLVALALRPDGVFSHHSALELLGAAHSEWNVVTVLTTRRREPLQLDGQSIEFLAPPAALLRSHQPGLGVQGVDRMGETLRVTGHERTLLDGFRDPGHVGGPAELVESAAGFPVLDLGLLDQLLEAYAEKRLYAATGWFLERYQRTFSVPDDFACHLEEKRPRSPQYLLRGQRGGQLAKRWNLIVPEELMNIEPDEG
jgi:hypothetical protein